MLGNEEGIEFEDAAGLISMASLECHEKTPFSLLCQRGSEGVSRKDAVTGAPEHPAGPPLPSFDPAADATIVFTSGSTGQPKAALHTFANHWASAVGANRNIPLHPGDRWLLSLPPWHVGGLAVFFRCLLGGAAVAIAGTGEHLADAIRSLGATHVSLVATQLYRLLRERRGRAALLGLKTILLGGGPAPAALVEEALRAGVRLVTSYGSTEMSSQTTASRPGDPPEALSTAGRPLAFRELSITADGEILVRGRTLFRGYIEETGIRPARDISGWFPTGDLGRLDADGRLIVTGRRDTMFISGGENIHPEEIEREILRFPGVLETVVVPMPDPEFGARPVAFLRTVDGSLPDAAALDRFLRLTLPGFKIPQRLLRWPELEEGIKPNRRTFAILTRDGLPPESLPEPAGIG
jgi:O-succinylbenzoic acid--CoA ligase